MSENLFRNKAFWHGATAGAGVAVMAVVFILGTIYGPGLRAKLKGGAVTGAALTAPKETANGAADAEIAALAEAVVPSGGIILPVKWGDYGRQLVEKGVIDREQFIALYQDRLGLGPNELKMLDDGGNGKIVMTSDNAGVILNLLWALGLGNKNPVLDNGPMTDERYGGAGKFASTGGWSLSRGDVMNHYSKHAFIKLTKKQQATVESVSQNIFRPCCNNPTYFPDCNHGMAMLALLEMMAAEGISESEMYKVALQVNSYWFPDTYLTLARYEAGKNVPWKNVDPKKMLSAEYSSASGYKAIRSQIQPVQQGGGGGCGV